MECACAWMRVCLSVSSIYWVDIIIFIIKGTNIQYSSPQSLLWAAEKTSAWVCVYASVSRCPKVNIVKILFRLRWEFNQFIIIIINFHSVTNSQSLGLLFVFTTISYAAGHFFSCKASHWSVKWLMDSLTEWQVKLLMNFVCGVPYVIWTW